MSDTLTDTQIRLALGAIDLVLSNNGLFRDSMRGTVGYVIPRIDALEVRITALAGLCEMLAVAHNAPIAADEDLVPT